jgi:hypothetical protein
MVYVGKILPDSSVFLTPPEEVLQEERSTVRKRRLVRQLERRVNEAAGPVLGAVEEGMVLDKRRAKIKLCHEEIEVESQEGSGSQSYTSTIESEGASLDIQIRRRSARRAAKMARAAAEVSQSQRQFIQLPPLVKKKSTGSEVRPDSSFWSPGSQGKIAATLLPLCEFTFKASFETASAAVEDYGVMPPQSSTLDALKLQEIKWDELISHLIHYQPVKLVYRRHEAKEVIVELSKEGEEIGALTEAKPLSLLRKPDLSNPDTSPCKAFWSPPKRGVFTRFCAFFRERFKITPGRNVSIAVVRNPETGSLAYSVASTDGPPGGTHAELLAWDILPDAFKALKRGIIFTERQPCCSGSNCNAKIKERLPEVAVIYTQPYYPGVSRSFISMAFLSRVAGVSVSAAAVSGVEEDI